MVRSAVRVLVRTRPSTKFAAENITIHPDKRSLTLHVRRQDGPGGFKAQQDDHLFRFDAVLHNSSQEDVYEEAAKQTVETVLEGYNGTILAYGQTGAGKTFTMSGGRESFQQRGIIPRVISHLFRSIRNRPEVSAAVRVSYSEVYNESVTDLLNPNSPQDLPVTEDSKGNVVVKGLTTSIVGGEEDALSLLFEGETNRAIAEHQLNRASSRSHTIFTLGLELRSSSDERVTVSKLNMVDLAGSERLSKTKSTGEVAREATYINKSLTFLEQVIMALSDRGRDHIPYRSSRLTHILKDSLGGNCRTVMVANIWGEAAQLDETLSTLKFASRMARVANEITVNVRQEPEAVVLRYEKEIRELKQELAMHDAMSPSRKPVSYDPYNEAQRAEVRDQVRQFFASSARAVSDDPLAPVEILSVRHVREVLLQAKALYLEQEQELEQRRQSGGWAGPADDRAPPGGATSLVEPAAAVAEEDEGVGDASSSGFSVGIAPSDARPSTGGSSFDNRGVVAGAVLGSRGLDANQGGPRGVGEGGVVEGVRSVDEASNRGGTDRAGAFEKFKQGAGLELSTALSENKAALREKKRKAKELALRVNEVKQEIDVLRVKVDERASQRAAATSAEDASATSAEESAPVVLDEDEYAWLVQLKELKKEYRTKHEELKMVRSEADYTNRLVEQCTQQLLLDFTKWYEGLNGVAVPLPPSREPDSNGQSSVDSRKAIKARTTSDALVPSNYAIGLGQHEVDDPEAAAFVSAQKILRKRTSPSKAGSITVKARTTSKA